MPQLATQTSNGRKNGRGRRKEEGKAGCGMDGAAALKREKSRSSSAAAMAALRKRGEAPVGHAAPAAGVAANPDLGARSISSRRSLLRRTLQIGGRKKYDEPNERPTANGVIM